MHDQNLINEKYNFPVLHIKPSEHAPQLPEGTQISPIVELFSRVSSLMLEAEHFHAFMDNAFADMGKTLHASRVQFYQCISGRYWSIIHEWTAPGITKEKKNMQRVDAHILTQDNFFSLAEQEKPCICNNVNIITDNYLRQLFLSQGVESFITVPLFYEGKVLGLLCFEQCTHVEQWAQQHTSTAITLGALMNSAYVYFRSKAKLLKKRQQLYDLFDVIPAPIYISTMDEYDILFQNAAMDELFGKEEIKQKKCYELYQALDEPCPFCTNSILPEDRTTYVWHHHNAVVKRDFRIIDCCIQWEEMEHCRFSLALDITENLIAQRTNVLEQEANLSKGQFIANMSHELRTPLNGIVGLTHLAEHANSHKIVAGYLKKIKLSSDTLLGVINKTLDLSDIENDNLKLNNRAFKLDDVVYGVQAILQGVADAKGIGLDVHVDNALPKTLVGDALCLSQIIINLSNNAIKFTTLGKVNISINACPPPHNNSHGDSWCTETASPQNAQNHSEEQNNSVWIKLTVEDTGIGIAEEKIATLFTEFSQVDSSTSRRYGGTGLGLSIVKQFVDLMGGELFVKSVPGKGSTFTCLIPFVSYEKIPLNDNTLHESAQSNIYDIKQTKVLVVEDNEINALIAQEVLETFQCIVDIAANGKICLDMLEQKQYDIVIMDIQMPVLDGLETAKAIRKNRRFDTLPIVAMSAHAMKHDCEKSFGAGMQEHISKPFDPENLRRVIYTFTQKGFSYEC